MEIVELNKGSRDTPQPSWTSFGSREIRFLEPAFKPQGTDYKGSGDLPDSDMKIVAGTTGVPEEPTGQE